MNNKERKIQRTRRAFLQRLAAAGTLGALGAGGLLGWTRSALAVGSLPATPGFRYVKGPVGVDDTRASIGLNVKPGQTVMTGENGEGVYIIGPDAFLQHEKGKITFEDDGGVQTMRIHFGRALCVFGKGHSGPRNIQVITPAATIALHNAGACYVEADAAHTHFCLCYGEAEVTPTGDPKQKETVKAAHHDCPLTIAAAGEKRITPAAFSNHTDNELVGLENAVGRWPPFYQGAAR